MGNIRRSLGRLKVVNQRLLDQVQGWNGVLPTPPEILEFNVEPPRLDLPEQEGSALRKVAKGKNTRAWLRHCINYGRDSFPGREAAFASYRNHVSLVFLNILNSI